MAVLMCIIIAVLSRLVLPFDSAITIGGRRAQTEPSLFWECRSLANGLRISILSNYPLRFCSVLLAARTNYKPPYLIRNSSSNIMAVFLDNQPSCVINYDRRFDQCKFLLRKIIEQVIKLVKSAFNNSCYLSIPSFYL